MALSLPAHQPGVIAAAALSGRIRDAVIGSGPFSLYLRVRTGGSGSLFASGGLAATGAGSGYVVGGLPATGTAGSIQHLVLTRTGGSAILYLDGLQVSAGAFGGSLATTFTVGAASHRIYRAALWNRVLAPTEIASLAVHGPGDGDRWGSSTASGCVLDLDFSFGIGRYLPDRSSNLSGAQTLGTLVHLLPVSYGSRSVVVSFDAAFNGSPFLLFELPPHCGFTGIEFESGGLPAASVGTGSDPDRFVSAHAVGAGLSYAPSLDLATQSAVNHTGIFLSGAAGTGFKVRCVYEVRGLPTVLYVPPPPDPIVVTAVADPDTVAPCETSSLIATVENGDGVSGVVWLIVSGPGSLSAVTPFTATYNAPCPYTSDAIAIIRATSVEDPSKSFEFPMSVDYTAPPPEILSVYIAADPLSIDLDGGTSLITAYVVGTGDFNAGLTWAIVGGTGTGILSFDSVLTRILDGTSTGSVVVRAISTGDPTKFADVTVGVVGGMALYATDDFDHGYDPNDTLHSWRPSSGGLVGILVIHNELEAGGGQVIMSLPPAASYNPGADPWTIEFYQISLGPDYDTYGWQILLSGDTTSILAPFNLVLSATTEGVDPMDPGPYLTGSITITVNPPPQITGVEVSAGTITKGSTPPPGSPPGSPYGAVTYDFTVTATGINLDPWYVGQPVGMTSILVAPGDVATNPVGNPGVTYASCTTSEATATITGATTYGDFAERAAVIRVDIGVGSEIVRGDSATVTIPPYNREVYLDFGGTYISTTDYSTYPSPNLAWGDTFAYTVYFTVRGEGGPWVEPALTPYVHTYSGAGGPGIVSAASFVGLTPLGGGYYSAVYTASYTAPANPGGFAPTASVSIRYTNPAVSGDLSDNSGGVGGKHVTFIGVYDPSA